MCGISVLCALAWTGSAFAAFDPSLIVMTRDAAPGRSASLALSLSGGTYARGEPTTGRVTVYAPSGYGVTLGHPAGTVLGALEVFVLVGGVPAGSQSGTVKAGDPAGYALDPCSPGRHDAVWILELAFAGRGVRLPVFVDRVTSGPEAAYASARMIACLPPPQAGVTVKDVVFGLRGVFSNPAARGTFAWNAVFVPYAAGTATLDPAGAVQNASSLRLPVTFAMKTRRHGSRLIVVACLREAGQPIRAARVSVYSGSPTRSGAKQLASARTNSRGCMTASVRPGRSRSLFAAALIGIRPLPGCRPTLAPRCSQGSLGTVSPLVRTSRVRR
jgi:hypothetical protein